ncbi:MAG: sensor histidine kinase [Planctomycetota bacterium]|nr:MAG: sensor histidine kinase [Planctomycetota bacterium]
MDEGAPTVASVPLPMASFDAGGRLRCANRAFAALLARPLEELLAQRPPYPELVYPLDRERVARARREGEVRLEYRAARPDGSLVLLAEWSGPGGSGGEAPRWIAVRDDSAEAWERARALRQRELAAYGELAGGAAHELNNRLAGVLNHAQLGLRFASAERVREALEGVEESARAVLETTRCLLAFAMSEADAKGTTDADCLARGLFTLFRRRLRDDSVRVVLDLDPALEGAPLFVRPALRVLLELVDNARWALGERYPGRHDDKELTLRFSLDGTDLACEVVDRGWGVSLDDPFAPFASARPDALGLGLCLAREEATGHGGSLELLPREGGGTVARLRLPLGIG